MNEAPTAVVVYFSEVPELREVLQETRQELESKGITQPTLRTKNGKVHTFDVLPEGFRVTDHLEVQQHVRCQVCTSEPPLRYEFQLQTTTGEWVGRWAPPACSPRFWAKPKPSDSVQRCNSMPCGSPTTAVTASSY